MDIVIVLAIVVAAVWWLRQGKAEEKVTLEPVEPLPTFDLESMTKAELIDFAGKLGAVVKKSWTKAKIVEAIKVKIGELGEKIRNISF